MEVRRFLSIAAATAVVGTAVLMTGCGSDDSSSGSIGSTTGVYDKARVPGISYKLIRSNGNATGITSTNATANGTFLFNTNDTVQFDLGAWNSTQNLTGFNASAGDLKFENTVVTNASGAVLGTTAINAIKKAFEAALEAAANKSGKSDYSGLSAAELATAIQDAISTVKDNSTMANLIEANNKEAIMALVEKSQSVNSTVAEASITKAEEVINTGNKAYYAGRTVDGFNTETIQNTTWSVTNGTHNMSVVVDYDTTNKVTFGTFITNGDLNGALINGTSNYLGLNGEYKPGETYNKYNSTDFLGNYTIKGINYYLSDAGITTNNAGNYTMNLTGLGSFNLSNATEGNTFSNGTWNGTWNISTDNLAIYLYGADDAKTNKTVAFKTRPTSKGFYAYVWSVIAGETVCGTSNKFYDATNGTASTTTGTWE